MRDHVKSLKRVLAVQQQIVKLAEWRLNASQRQSVELKADQVRLDDFIAGENLTPLLSVAAFKRGKTLQIAVARVDAAVATQTLHSDAMRRREKLAEKLVDKAVREAEQVAEKRHLEETIEAWSWREDASFP